MVVENKSAPALQAERLSFGYDRESVLSEVSLELNPGDVLGIIGPNGSGKSTLLGLLCGLLAPDEGRVLLFGRDLTAHTRKETARLIGVVPQTPELAPGFTVLETVLAGRFALMERRVFENTQDLAAAEQAMDLTDLTELSGRPAGELSGGERQRLALARALAAEPEILLLDEPTSALDLDHQLKTMALLEEACARARLSVCLVSHDLNLAALFCRRLLLLSRGRPLAQGPPEEVIRPESLSRAYGVRALVDKEPTRGRPRVTLVPPPVPNLTSGHAHKA